MAGWECFTSLEAGLGMFYKVLRTVCECFTSVMDGMECFTSLKEWMGMFYNTEERGGNVLQI